MEQDIYITLYDTNCPPLCWSYVAASCGEDITSTRAAKTLRKAFCKAYNIKHPSQVAWIVLDKMDLSGNVIALSSNFSLEQYRTLGG